MEGMAERLGEFGKAMGEFSRARGEFGRGQANSVRVTRSEGRASKTS